MAFPPLAKSSEEDHEQFLEGGSSMGCHRRVRREVISSLFHFQVAE